MKYLEHKTCTPKCRSTKHAEDLIALITQTRDPHILLSGIMQCWNCHKINDKFGRTLLHMAASCGRSEICEWLIKYKKADIHLKTIENGFTPIHCASFYGQIDVLVLLLKLGASLTKNDRDRLNVLEGLSLDKWLSTKYQPDYNDDLDVYCWGSNANFNLGNGHEMKKMVPEINEYFKKTNTTIVQIVVSKFHSVFRSKSGEVFTCGFGIGGRLGHSNEETLITPKLVEQLKHLKCVQIAASRNNTYFLTSDGVVYSCGTNEFKQLGQTGVEKSLSPKPINLSKLMKGKQIKQVACSRLACAILTTSNEMFTFGLNAGQIGHINEKVAKATSYNNTICYISEPRLVTSLNEKGIELDLIACSDGCTVCLQSSKNILHVFNDYKSKRLFYLKETGSPFKKVLVNGGKLDHMANADLKWIDSDYFNLPITIVGLTNTNLLYIWKEEDQIWRLITWSKNKKILVTDFDLNTTGIILCTIQGLCYKAEFSKQKQLNQTVLTNTISSPNFNIKEQSHSPPILATQEVKTEILELKPIPFLNRCFSVANDMKARNFFALQYHPNTNMKCYPIQMHSCFKEDMKIFFEENASKDIDTNSKSENFGFEKKFHDIELKYRNTTFGLHKFILLSRCPKFFQNLDLQNNNSVDLETYFNNSKFNLFSFEIVLHYIYTNDCSIDFIKKAIVLAKINNEAQFIKFIADFKECFVDKFGLTELKSSFDSNNYLKVLKDLHLNKNELDDRYDSMSDFFHKLIGQQVLSASKQSTASSKRKQLKFFRNSYTGLYDCQIECNNCQLIECHKTVLIARNDYFRNMFLGDWRESYMEKIKLPFDADLMQIFVDYLYTDEIQLNFIHSTSNSSSSVKSKNEREIEILFNLFVLGDQLLVERLKNLCEFKLANLVNLKNVCEIFEFSSEYDAQQLKEFCMEFITCNLVTLIEAKQLETISLDLLKDFSNFYRNYYPLVGSRMVTPYSTKVLDPEKIDLIPIDLIYDQSFVDGSSFLTTQNSSNLINKADDISGQNPIGNLNDTGSSEMNISNNESYSLVATEEDISLEVIDTSSNSKWEKVRKKNRRKISEKDTVSSNFQNNNNMNHDKITSSKIISASKVMSPTLASNQVVKNNMVTLLDEKEKIDQSKPLGKKIEDEWPELNANSECLSQVKKSNNNTNNKKPATLEKHILPKNSIRKKISMMDSVTAKSSVPKSIEQSKSNNNLAWGGVNLNQSSGTTKFIDVLNDEMKKINLIEEKQIKLMSNNSTIEQKQENNIQVSKGWNLQKNEPNKSSSFAQIIEMEKISKEKYNRLKNRPLNLIQIEEKAIEDLRKYYDIDNQTTTTIDIQLVDDLNINNLAPVWKKN